MQLSRFSIAFKALRQLGPVQVGLNLLYKFGLTSGHYRRTIQPPAYDSSLALLPLMPMPDSGQIQQVLGETRPQALINEANEIVNGSFRQFGGNAVPIRLAPEGPLAHWTEHETGKIKPEKPASDIKFTWEPARFGWAFVLGRAYHLSSDERYAQAFWSFFEEFNKANPAYFGPNWTSGQEVGLRLMAWVWAGQIFTGSAHTNPARLTSLANAIALHAARIPATLPYARSQNNNHLLTEAAALYTAGLALPTHNQAAIWLKTGERWLAWCFEHQIDANGEYVQHSSNYQRLMLQTALWVKALAAQPADASSRFPGENISIEKLALASGWVLSQLDRISGQLPNLGANDGALIFPFSSCDFSDYRPAAQAAARAFLPAANHLPAGAWDEMSLWFGLPITKPISEAGEQKPEQGMVQTKSPGIIGTSETWASLRAIQYGSRPSHADQLHCELWWRGLNIAQDAGTYSYNAGSPWDNQLTSTLVHNTVSVNAQEQMLRAGRFLYLDWAGAEYFDQPTTNVQPGRRVSARTDAYQRFGVRHIRSLMLSQDRDWMVEDRLEKTVLSGKGQGAQLYRLQWLLPDWKWQMEQRATGLELRIQSPLGWIILAISSDQPIQRTGLVRAGELIHGRALLQPCFGWVSPTYNIKRPALSLAVEVESPLQAVSIQSKFTFPHDG